MSHTPTANTLSAEQIAQQQLAQQQLDAFSMLVNPDDSSVNSDNSILEIPDLEAAAAMRSQRLNDFFFDLEGPYTRSVVRSQSLTPGQAAMAQQIADFDLRFFGPPPTPSPPRRHTH